MTPTRPDRPEESYFLKLERAGEHLDELRRRLAPFSELQEFKLRRRVDKRGRPRTAAYSVYVDEPQDPMLPIIAGDFLYNLRSALDHAAVAKVPSKYKRTVSFPIFTEDPFEVDLETGSDISARADQRDAWARCTAGMSPYVVQYLRDEVQPFTAVKRQPGGNAKDHLLAILSALQNADKHRQLIAVGIGLQVTTLTRQDGDVVSSADLRCSLPPGDLLRNGEEFLLDVPLDTEIRIYGRAVAAFGVSESDGLRPFPELFDTISVFVQGIVGRLHVGP
jgi:hypothetical protein